MGTVANTGSGWTTAVCFCLLLVAIALVAVSAFAPDWVLSEVPTATALP